MYFVSRWGVLHIVAALGYLADAVRTVHEGAVALVRVESPFPSAVKKIMIFSAAYLVWYYSTHPPKHEFLLRVRESSGNSGKEMPDRVVIQL